MAALKAAEQERGHLRAELDALDQLAEASTFDAQQTECQLREKLDEWRGLLRRQTPLARQVRARLLDGRIVWTPNKEAGTYEYSGRVKFDGLLDGVVFTRGMVSPTGFGLLWRPEIKGKARVAA